MSEYDQSGWTKLLELVPINWDWPLLSSACSQDVLCLHTHVACCKTLALCKMHASDRMQLRKAHMELETLIVYNWEQLFRMGVHELCVFAWSLVSSMLIPDQEFPASLKKHIGFIDSQQELSAESQFLFNVELWATLSREKLSVQSVLVYEWAWQHLPHIVSKCQRRPHSQDLCLVMARMVGFQRQCKMCEDGGILGWIRPSLELTQEVRCLWDAIEAKKPNSDDITAINQCFHCADGDIIHLECRNQCPISEQEAALVMHNYGQHQNEVEARKRGPLPNDRKTLASFVTFMRENHSLKFLTSCFVSRQKLWQQRDTLKHSKWPIVAMTVRGFAVIARIDTGEGVATMGFTVHTNIKEALQQWLVTVQLHFAGVIDATQVVRADG